MKKKFFAALVAVLVIAMSTFAVAGGSPSAQETGSRNVDSPTAAPATAAYAATTGTTTTASGATITATAADATTIATMNAQTKAISPLAYVLSTAEYSGKIKAGGENVALSCVSVKASDTVDTIVVLHMGKNGMEVLKPSAVSAGSVTVFLTDLSPITITHVPEGTKVAYTNTKSGKTSTSTGKKSPKTGEE